ncbi:MAG: hypothetical protein KKB50_05785 [Planctomycetes bacterium]|nr:hypothetical protein [Planctomycetota bacterium]
MQELIPPWDGTHPYLAHFPIALLSIAPLLVVLGLLLGRRGPMMLWAALLLMVIGTLTAYLTSATGDAAAQRLTPPPAVLRLLERHEDLANLTLPPFSLLTLGFAAMLVVPRCLKVRGRHVPRWLGVVIYLVFLGGYAGTCLLLTYAGHYGGELVHEYGVHARLKADEHEQPDVPATPLSQTSTTTTSDEGD